MIKLFDTTLRDGLQYPGANMSLSDKIKTFGEIDNLGVDFIEVGWPASPNFDQELFVECKKIRKNAKIVAFGSTSIDTDPKKDRNLESVLNSGADYACIFGKTWLVHVEKQLHSTPEENLRKISESVGFLVKNGMEVIYDAEHYFDGFKENEEYAIKTLESAAKAGAKYLVFCDTRGGTLTHEVVEIIKKTKFELEKRGIKTKLGTHFHDDSGLAVSNALYSAEYVDMIQGTINGMGERVGNLNLITFAANWTYKMGGDTKLDFKGSKKVSEEVWRMAGLQAPGNLPFVGENAFAHKGGVHIDAVKKGASYEHVNAEDFGNSRLLLLTSLGGRGSISEVAQRHGYNHDKKNPEFIEKANKLFNRLKHLEEKGYRIEALAAEQFLLIEEFFGNLGKFFEFNETEISTKFGGNDKESSKAQINGRIENKNLKNSREIYGGPVHALYQALSESLVSTYPMLKNLKIHDFHVDLARYHGVQSTVRVPITFSDGENFTVVGVSDNIIRASREAIEKGFRYYLQRKIAKKQYIKSEGEK